MQHSEDENIFFNKINLPPNSTFGRRMRRSASAPAYSPSVFNFHFELTLGNQCQESVDKDDAVSATATETAECLEDYREHNESSHSGQDTQHDELNEQEEVVFKNATYYGTIRDTRLKELAINMVGRQNQMSPSQDQFEGELNDQSEVSNMEDYSLTSKYDLYNPSSKNQPQGMGYVLVFAYFVSDLAGYRKDIDVIHSFFSELNYKVVIHKNLCKEKTLHALKTAKRELENYAKYDRLFVYILSHGDEHGIRTCRRTTGVLPETYDSHGNPIRLSSEEILAPFGHAQCATLRGYPKTFLFHICRGKYDVQDSENKFCFSGYAKHKISQMTLSSDTLVCYATLDRNVSFAHPGGCWFIQESTEALKKFKKHMSVVEILLQLNHILSKKSATLVHKGRITGAHLTIDMCSSLTKEFYLHFPNYLREW